MDNNALLSVNLLQKYTALENPAKTLMTVPIRRVASILVGSRFRFLP